MSNRDRQIYASLRAQVLRGFENEFHWNNWREAHWEEICSLPVYPAAKILVLWGQAGVRDAVSPSSPTGRGRAAEPPSAPPRPVGGGSQT